MVLAKVVLERVVVDIVLLLTTTVTSIADVAAFVLVTTMRVQLVVAIETFSTKATFRVSLEPTLVNGAWVVVTEFLVLSQLRKCEEIVFVSKDFFISCTKIAVKY